LLVTRVLSIIRWLVEAYYLKVKQIWNKIMNGYGHNKPISEILESVNKYFL